MKCDHCGNDVSVENIHCPNCNNILAITDDLISLAAKGDQDAITTLYNRTYNKVYHTIKSIISDDDTVLDIIQDSYIKGFKNLSQLESAERFASWMKRIAVNTAKDYLKKKKPVLFSDLANEDGELDFVDDRTEHLPEKVIDAKETTRLVNEILNTLSEEQRMVVGMFYYEQMSVKEIAHTLDCSESTVKSRLFHGRKKIESKVLELEKKGTKLYSLAPVPFLMLLFKSVEIQSIEIPSAAILSAIKLQCGTAAAGAIASGTATQSVSGTGIKAAISAISKTVGAKVAVATVAVTIATGGTVAIINSRKSPEPTALPDTTYQVISTEVPSETTSVPTKSPVPTEIPASAIKVDFSDYVAVFYNGKSGEAVASYEFSQAELEQYIKTQWGEDDDISKKESELSKLMNTIAFEPSQTDNLTNGDTYVLNITYDRELAAEYGYAFLNTYQTYSVVGLSDSANITDIDPFGADIFGDGNPVFIKYEGTAPYGSITITNNAESNNPVSMIKYSADKTNNLKNGDTITITATFASGHDTTAYKLTRSTTTVTVSGLNSYVTDVSLFNSSAVNNLQNKFSSFYQSNKIAPLTMVDASGTQYKLNTGNINSYGDLNFTGKGYAAINGETSYTILTFTAVIKDVTPLTESVNNTGYMPTTTYPCLYGYCVIDNLLLDSEGNILNINQSNISSYFTSPADSPSGSPSGSISYFYEDQAYMEQIIMNTYGGASLTPGTFK